MRSLRYSHSRRDQKNESYRSQSRISWLEKIVEVLSLKINKVFFICFTWLVSIISNSIQICLSRILCEEIRSTKRPTNNRCMDIRRTNFHHARISCRTKSSFATDGWHWADAEWTNLVLNTIVFVSKVVRWEYRWVQPVKQWGTMTIAPLSS